MLDTASCTSMITLYAFGLPTEIYRGNIVKYRVVVLWFNGRADIRGNRHID